MSEKRVLVTFNRAPFGSVHYTEGLRAVIGVTSGIDEHAVDVVYLGDGVYYTLADVDRTDSQLYLGTLEKLGYTLQVEHESLTERGLSAENLAPDVQVIGRDEVLNLINKADVTIDF
jgi:sulfur relay (sulfurtransferase) DsrF/TusC family protein